MTVLACAFIRKSESRVNRAHLMSDFALERKIRVQKVKNKKVQKERRRGKEKRQAARVTARRDGIVSALGTRERAKIRGCLHASRERGALVKLVKQSGRSREALGLGKAKMRDK